MYPPIFPVVAASSAVKALIGNNPVRFYQFGMNDTQPAVYPYAVWQRVGGSPENYVDQIPDIDSFNVQVDVYVSPSEIKGGEKCRQIAAALRDAIEPAAHITAWLGESRDPDTKAFRFTFLTDWWTNR